MKKHLAPDNELFKEFPDLVDISQLQQMLNIGRNAAYKLLQSNQIPSKIIAHKYRIPKIYIKKYVLGELYLD